MYNLLKKFVRTRLKAFRFFLSEYNSVLFTGFYRWFYRPKAGSLSELLDTYSQTKKGDLWVVQVGANDGITHDPIHKFIKRDAWKGVLLEPQPFVYHSFLKKIYRKNPGIQTRCAALGHEDGFRTLYKIGFSNMRWATGLASFQRETLQKAFDSGLVAARCKKHGISIPTDPTQQITSEEVQVITPQSLLREHKVPRIDLLQIDTEGFDYEVIKMFDVAMSKPKLIVFEYIHLSESDKEACRQQLEKHGYQYKSFGSNMATMREPLGDFEPFFREKDRVKN